MSEIKRNLRRVVKVQPTMTADDNADNDVAFNWTKIEGACSEKGLATMLQSVAILDADDSAAPLELVFCKGRDEAGTQPAGAQALGTASAAVDITGAEAQAVGVCGSVQMTLSEGDLINAQVITKTNIGLVLQPGTDTDAIFVGAIWRGDPASTGATDSMDIYFGFED
tara:strand:- start:252 stop:755 length:504 start_codon:yes stop_codon:yes gene_type:complete